MTLQQNGSVSCHECQRRALKRGESRHPEWDLMYCKGLTVGQIATLCGAVRETVGRHLRVQRSLFTDMQLQHEANRPPANPRPISRSWQANIDSLSAIWKAEGHYPTSNDPNFQRRRLAHWLSVQRRASSNGTLTQAKKAALEVLPRWEENQRLARDRMRWLDRLDGVRAFKTEHKRWPRFRKAESETERILGVWLHGQRQKALRNGLLSHEHKSLDAVIPGWNTWRQPI